MWAGQPRKRVWIPGWDKKWKSIPGFWDVAALRISRQLAHEGGKVVSPTHRPPLLPRI